ncbi:NUAK family SNF1-like kinase 1 [Clinocottus analis]|uniref:NUAK family SNF1-like kinase 1 n=1 Tax=Clinocottus analis TaxID=304258 RepID=UPI0035BF8E0C
MVRGFGNGPLRAAAGSRTLAAGCAELNVSWCWKRKRRKRRRRAGGSGPVQQVEGCFLTGGPAQERMGRRAADSGGAMNTGDRCAPGGPRDAAAAEENPDVKKHQHKHNLKHRYELMETLGKGTYGKVRKAVERASLRTVAIKSIRKERITDDLDRVHIQREIEITASLRHPNIVRFHEVFESRDKIVIVMEFASRGELYDYVQERRRLPEPEARSIFRQIASAVHYCHKNGVVHRDLKLENILLDQELNVKLADFGLSNHFQRGVLLQTFCGSPLYAAPEIVRGLPYKGPEVDCWALGVLLYALVYSSMPFDGASHAALTEQISQGRYRRPDPPSDACALIDWLLAVRVDERATIEDVANHWWVNWGFEESVCDCPSSPHQECPSPLLARYIDWQSRVAATSDMAVDPACLSSDASGPPQLSPHPFCFSFPLKSDRGGGGGGGKGGRPRGGMSSLRKSRKENTIPQTAPGACGGVCAAAASSGAISSASAAERKKPKGILKPQRSFDSVFPSVPKENPSPSQGAPRPYRTHTLSHMRADLLPAGPPPPPPASTFSQPSSKMPKKGILKNLCGGESGRGSTSGEVKGGAADPRSHTQQHPRLPAADDGPAVRDEAVRRRKGILKRDGKFSRSLDLPAELRSTPAATFPEALHLQQQLVLLRGAEGRRSRPSSVVSEDSLLSSDSFDLLDLSAHQPRRRFFSRGRRHSACSSEEDPEPPRAEAGGDGRKDMLT